MSEDSFSDNFLVISPPSQYINLVAGETYSGSISVSGMISNIDEMEFFVSIIPYGVNAENYAADFDSDNIYNDIVDWVSVDIEHGFLSPNEVKEIRYTIKVPDNVPSGGQYCAIAVRNTGASTDGVVNEIIEIASIIYARIEGDIVESGEVVSYNLPSILLAPPIVTSFSFKNGGNIHLNASINTKITNYFDGEVFYDSYEWKETITETIMPETARTVNYTFNEVPKLGVLRLTQTVIFNGEKTDVSQLVFVCPIWFLVLILTTLIAIVTTIIRTFLRHRHLKRK